MLMTRAQSDEFSSPNPQDSSFTVLYYKEKANPYV